VKSIQETVWSAGLQVRALFSNVLHEDDLTSLLCYFHINSPFVTWITPPLQEIDAIFPSVKMSMNPTKGTVLSFQIRLFKV